MSDFAGLNEEQIGLINAAVDGMLSSSQQPDFDKLLRDSATARKLHAQLMELAGQLDETPAVEPPAWLEEVILAQHNLPTGAKAADGSKDTAAGSSGSGLLHALRSTGAGQYAMGLLIVALLGGAWIRIGEHQFVDGNDEQLMGTMIAPGQPISDEGASSASISLAGLQGDITGSAADGYIELKFDLQSSEPIEVRVKPNQQTLSNGVLLWRDSDDESAKSSFTALPGRRTVQSLRLAIAPHVVHNTEDSAIIDVVFVRNGDSIHSISLTIPLNE